MAPTKSKKPDYSSLRHLFKPHIESFDYFIDKGMELALTSIRPVEIADGNTKLRIYFGEPRLLPPRDASANRNIYPQECREARTTYKGDFSVEVFFQYNDGPSIRHRLSFGQLPIMLMSKRCHLRGADPSKLIYHKEEATEMGGYFICNGLERLCRLLILQKRNYPMSLVRKVFRARGDGYSDKAVVMRCVREDQSGVTVKLYYLQNGSARLGFWIGGREFLLPVGIVLKALIDTNDHEIYVSLTCCYKERYQREKGAVGTQLIGERAQIILDEVRNLSLFTRSDCLKHIGEYFKPAIDGFEAESYTAVADAVLRDYIFVHLTSNHDKFNLLIFMLQKLYALVDQTAAPDNGDVLQNQEVLLPGHLISIYLKEKVVEWLRRSRRLLAEEMAKSKDFSIKDPEQVKKFLARSSVSIGRSIESMLKVGRLATASSLDLPQKEGVTIQAERLNYLRFISHFCAVHRGAAFAKMRTTVVRKLMPESWGFLCPVHTPDGEPCGLLNHMTSTCCITSYFNTEGKVKDFRDIQRSIQNVLIRLGMSPLLPKLEHAGPPEVLQVLLDGRLVGSIACTEVEKAVAHIRSLKLSASSRIPDDLEVGYVPLSLGGAYPGLYLFTSPSRFLRPVRNISHTTDQNIELIGPFEQAFMEIRCADGSDGGRRSFPATHEEIHPTGILSVVANLTPWSDHNQSPRNMYQCQMAKQTMGFSSQAIRFRTDVKAYHLQTPQSPIVRTASYNKYCVDEFPTGTNAIVAVLAYSGYDMEDAMILNKSSVDRGLCRGHIYQTESIDLAERQEKSSKKVFARSNDKSMSSSIDSDGLPYIGQMVKPKEPLYSTYDDLTSDVKSTLLKGSEPVIVDNVTVIGTASKNCMQKVNIRTRRIRNPIIGDKFSSRHGQKGVCSQLWPDIDMPFSAVTGMRPDLIINPHAFPSRMTIGMLLESIAAKAGSLHGKFIDATPFASSVDKKDGKERSERSSLVDELGPMLASHGFNYHGSEVLYSGFYGTEMTCEIFIGPVYYQRLRHMVSDKFQVRSTGTVDPITRQPVGGRKRGGGIRFGEMERDSVLAHGAAYLLHDRLHSCSDYHIAEVCSFCGSLLTATVIQQQKRIVQEIPGVPQTRTPKNFTCHACKTKKGMETVAMPYVFRYLAAELAAMNIRMELKLSNRAGC
ncbi:DNA-directed RNA polymerase I subunit 2 isoform X2 [Asparagus officinalis]|uniref:DNA-directed RNA polymerase I subunit 2 isoform X2 n=1 Tax=Asparagus officinalis TaxID=4686 RepID=UPI00098DF62C|nr:DNA-directed RNA polymerase I subunit 2 isoform X2 [Asparagus officinalis]